ncbi:MAG: caspase family protein, partial [Desulfobulbaceae bacterium]|nr:caspase family protein [Desulfobulbaceae bacterium]
MANKALLVGINDYAPVGPGGPDLRGCVNDVR